MNNKTFLILFFCALLQNNSVAQTDQSLIYSSYFGGSGEEFDALKGLDTREDKWISGSFTLSSDIPLEGNSFQTSNNGDLDGFIGIFDLSGTVVYSTYVGGSDYDVINAVRFLQGIDGFVISGVTKSLDFPTTASAFLTEHQGADDGFVSRFDEEGQLLWSTFFGGSAMDRILDMAVDASGFVYIVGRTSSSGLGTPGVYQPENIGTNAFLAKFDSDGTLMWCTYFGDTGDEIFRAVDISPDGTSVYCAGSANSAQNIAHNGWQNTYGGTGDALLTNFNTADGTLNWSTYYGGSENDEASAIIVASDGDIYIGGRTRSDSNIASAGAHKENLTGYSDNFLVCFSPEGNREWATYYGGSNAEESGINLTMQTDNIIMSGFTNSQDNIAFGNPFDSGGVGGSSYLVKFDATGQIIWGTYFLSDRPGGAISALKTLPQSEKLITYGSVLDMIEMSDIITPDAYQSSNAGGVDLIFYVFEDNTLSAKTHTLNPLKVYPNPATDMVTIERPENLTGNFNLEVFDMMGKLVLRKSLNTWSAGINVSKLTTGAYILKINTDKEIYRTKLIVE